LCHLCDKTVTISARTPRVLTIAGSDSGGGAGIQADLKAFAACGVHGMTAITAITAQNTVGVDALAPVEPAMVIAQVRAVQRDIGIDAVKIGMLGTVATIDAVLTALEELDPVIPIVLDPVMVAESGASLLEPDACAALVSRLLPRVTVATPNLPEAQAIAQTPDADAAELARAIQALGPTCVVVTGGHREQAVDVFFDGLALVEIPGERYPNSAAHGSGCTHSSVFAAQLALGRSPLQAAREARRLAGGAVAQGLRDVGGGSGPVDVLDLAGRRTKYEQGNCGDLFVCHNRDLMRLLRLKPGHGEVLLAEGDPQVPEQAAELIRAFREELDAGMWAAIPVTKDGGRRQAEMVKSFDEVPLDTERVIFFPRAAGGANP
jgi:hydroxymethylpyrimidine/phosphomethylpyrimidine kinase